MRGADSILREIWPLLMRGHISICPNPGIGKGRVVAA